MGMPQPHELDIDGVLSAVAEASAQLASASLAQLVGRNIGVTTTSVQRRSGEAGRPTRWLADAEGACASLEFHGPPDGEVFVEFPPPAVAGLIETLGVADDADISASMLAEVANILAASYLTGLADTWEVALDPTPVALVEGARPAPGSVTGESIEFRCGITDKEGRYNVTVLVLIEAPAGFPEGVA